MVKKQMDIRERFKGAHIGKGVQLCGVKNTSIGDGSCIGDDVWLNVCVRDEKIRLQIGRCVLVGRRSVISTGGNLEIGNYCIVAPNVYVGDVDHNYTNNINLPIILRGSTDYRSMVIEESCWLAMNCVVTGSLTLGRGCVVGANSVVNKDVPPFSVVAGNPAKIVKMYDPVTKDWVSTRSHDDQKRVLENREKVAIPSREEYKKLLDSANLDTIDPIVAGGEQHI
jgi:acetyltransferase-like isoleucine patch superfamily enzyme